MNRASRIVLLATLAFTGATLVTKPCLASHDLPVVQASECYRDAVKKFEQLVIRTRYIENYDERLVDDLEDSTSRLRSAARDTRRPDRLWSRFSETAALHARVEGVFFTRTLYPRNPAFDDCWSIVCRAFADLEYHMQEVPRHYGRGQQGHSYKRPVYSGGHTPTYRPTTRYTVPPVSVINPDSFYRSAYGPTFRSDTYGPRPALTSPPRPALTSPPRPALTSPPRPALTSPQPKVYTRTINVGALLQRLGR